MWLLQLLLLLLLLLLLAQLQVLHELLWSANGRSRGGSRLIAGREAGTVRGGRLLVGCWLLIVLVVTVWLTGSPGGSGLSAALQASAEQNLPRQALALIANHQDVISGALQQLREHIPRLARAIVAKDALVRGQAFHRGSCGRRNVLQDLLKAGVGRVDAKTVTVPKDRGLGGLIVGRPVGSRRHQWSDRG